MTPPDFDQAVEQYHRAIDEFYKGDPEPVKRLTSHRVDVSLAGGFGDVSHGWEQVARNLDNRASKFRSGQPARFDTVAKFSEHDLGYIVEIERFQAKVGGREGPAQVALRVTTIFRHEDGVWKMVHRHGDPMVSTIDPATYLSLV